MELLNKQSKCVACGKPLNLYTDTTIVYCESKHIKDQGIKDSMETEITTIGDMETPSHLDVSCDICGFTWLEECYDIK